MLAVVVGPFGLRSWGTMSEGYEPGRLATQLLAVARAGAAYETSHTGVVASLASVILMGSASGSIKTPESERCAKPIQVGVVEAVARPAPTKPASGTVVGAVGWAVPSALAVIRVKAATAGGAAFVGGLTGALAGGMGRITANLFNPCV